MSYTLNHGVKNEGMDNTQRGLLIGLPLIALLLSFGAIHRHNSDNKVSASSSTIPVVSSLNGNGKSAGDSNSNNSDNNPDTAPGSVQNGTSLTPAYASGVSLIGSGGTASSTPSPTGSTTPIVGGMGGGPTGGGGSTGGGGTTTLPNCTIGQIATYSCVVPACSPPVTLAAGQKAILGIAGTCIVVN